MNAETAKTEAQIYLRDFESEIPTTISLLRSIPTSNLSYKPDAKSNTGLALCRHIVLNDTCGSWTESHRAPISPCRTLPTSAG